MFCGQCGSKLSEEAVFCPYCGNKINKFEESGTPTEISLKRTDGSVKETSAGNSPLQNERLQKAYDKLRENISSCPQIKEITLPKNQKLQQLVLKGGFNMYSYSCSPEVSENEKTVPNDRLGWEWKVLYKLLLIPPIICDVFFLDLFFRQEYNLVLSVLTLAGCAVWFFLVIRSERESRKIVSFVEKTVDCRLPLSGWYKAARAVQYLLNFTEALMCIFTFILEVM